MTIKKVAVGNFNSSSNEADFIAFGPGPQEQGLRVVEGTVPVEDMIFRFLDTNGDGTGTKNANGNYASSATEFKITGQSGEVLELHRMLIAIRDGVTLSADDYAGAGVLTNGITVYVKNSDGDICLNLTDGVPIQAMACWSRYCYDERPDDYGAGDNFVAVRWTFDNAGSPLVLPVGYSLNVLCNDDLSALTSHHFQVQGHVRRNF